MNGPERFARVALLLERLGAPGVVLASGSPRRRDLLAGIGLRPQVRPVRIDETREAGESAKTFARRMAIEKLRAAGGSGSDLLVLAADTVVAVDGDVLGKPADEAEATDMLGRLAGRSHEVVTGLAMAQGTIAVSGTETTRVTFRPLAMAEIEAYLETGEPMDKAGAYGAQGRGALFVSRVEGCYHNVVGLPLARLVRLCRELATAREDT